MSYYHNCAFCQTGQLSGIRFSWAGVMCSHWHERFSVLPSLVCSVLCLWACLCFARSLSRAFQLLHKTQLCAQILIYQVSTGLWSNLICGYVRSWKRGGLLNEWWDEWCRCATDSGHAKACVGECGDQECPVEVRTCCQLSCHSRTKPAGWCFTLVRHLIVRTPVSLLTLRFILWTFQSGQSRASYCLHLHHFISFLLFYVQNSFITSFTELLLTPFMSLYFHLLIPP